MVNLCFPLSWILSCCLQEGPVGGASLRAAFLSWFKSTVEKQKSMLRSVKGSWWSVKEKDSQCCQICFGFPAANKASYFFFFHQFNNLFSDIELSVLLEVQTRVIVEEEVPCLWGASMSDTQRRILRDWRVYWWCETLISINQNTRGRSEWMVGASWTGLCLPLWIHVHTGKSNTIKLVICFVNPETSWLLAALISVIFCTCSFYFVLPRAATTYTHETCPINVNYVNELRQKDSGPQSDLKLDISSQSCCAKLCKLQVQLLGCTVSLQVWYSMFDWDVCKPAARTWKKWTREAVEDLHVCLDRDVTTIGMLWDSSSASVRRLCTITNQSELQQW